MALCDVRRVRNCCFYDYICFGALISWIPTAINAVSTHNLPLGVSSAYHRRIIGVSSTYRESTSLWITEISLPFFFQKLSDLCCTCEHFHNNSVHNSTTVIPGCTWREYELPSAVVIHGEKEMRYNTALSALMQRWSDIPQIYIFIVINFHAVFFFFPPD